MFGGWDKGEEGGPSKGSPTGLYERYGPDSSSPVDAVEKAHSATRSSQLRQLGVRLNVYLNCEGVGVTVVGGPKGHGTIVQLPAEIDTLNEVLRHIQLKLDLNQRMLYAADIFLPDGYVIKNMTELIDAARLETPVIVGCGEPFDGSRVPHDLLEFHRQGGGRAAVHKVNDELKLQRRDFKRDKAETVRQDGHGVYPNSLAVVNARTQAVEANREKAAYMRQRYLEGLVRRTEDDQDYLRAAQANIMFHKMEEEEGRAAREDFERERMERLNGERLSSVKEIRTRRAAETDRVQMLHAKIKAGKEQQKEKTKLAKQKYALDARTDRGAW
mmetsp:Transcript_3464/g.7468  ORF Transcript_3464/g.7468 Transcript_3464/m.7468 type:complete len:329 (-) Transcript_3464:672-1658(-)